MKPSEIAYWLINEGLFFDMRLSTVSQFRCCGVTNHTDWFEVYNATRVPDSCCLEYSDNCGLDNPGTWWTAVSSCNASKGGNLNTIPVFGGLATPLSSDGQNRYRNLWISFSKQCLQTSSHFCKMGQNVDTWSDFILINYPL